METNTPTSEDKYRLHFIYNPNAKDIDKYIPYIGDI